MSSEKPKAQAALEYMVLLGVVLFFVIIVFVYASLTLEDMANLNHAKASVETIAQTIDNAYALGPGTRLYADIYYPSNVESTILTNKEVGLTVNLSSGPTDVFEYVEPDLVGSIVLDEGPQRVLVEVLDSGVVRVGEYGITDFLAPIIYLESPDDNYTDTDGYVQFDYNVSDLNSEIAYCALVINGGTDQTDYTVSEGVTQSFYKTFVYNGAYTWNVRCTDNSANANTATALNGPRDLNISIALDYTPPVIYLESPPDYNTDQDGTISFDYNVNDVNTAVAFCELIIDGSLDQTDYSITEGVTQSFLKVGLGDGNHSWDVNCTDNSGNANEGQSLNGPWHIYVAKTQASDFSFSWANAYFAVGGRRLRDWTIANDSNSQPLQITRMKVQDWYNYDLDGAALTEIQLNGVTVWTGLDTTGAWLDITDFNIPASTSYTVNNRLIFNRRMNNDGEDFNILFEFSDATIYATPPLGSSDFNAPIVQLIAPAHNALDSDGLVSFDFNVVDLAGGISYCDLFINGVFDQNKDDPLESTTLSFNKVFSSSGVYTWDVNCRDNSLNQNLASSINGPRDINVQIADTLPPIVQLKAPAPGYSDGDGNVQFDFNVNDTNSGVSYCTLVINGAADQNKSPISEGVTQSFFKYNMPDGNYYWDVNCVDDSSNANRGSSDQNRWLNVKRVSYVVRRWAQLACDWPLCQSTTNVTGAPDNVYNATTSQTLGGRDFNVAGLSGTISKVRIIWSHQVPGSFTNDRVDLHYGFATYDQALAKSYTSANTPVDYMDTNVSLLDYYDATSNRPGGGSWLWSDFNSMRIGGDYVKQGGADSEWRLDAVGLEITYSS